MDIRECVVYANVSRLHHDCSAQKWQEEMTRHLFVMHVQMLL